MSDQRTCTGTLVPVSDENCYPEQVAERIIRERFPQHADDEDYSSHCEALHFISRGEYILLGNTLYKHTESTNANYCDDICVITEMGDGSLIYTTSFYDGGTHLAEVLQEGYEERHRLNTDLAVIERFVKAVNKRAERKMLITHKLEGSHHAAMTQILDELKRGGKLDG